LTNHIIIGSNTQTESTKVLSGEQNVISIELQFFYNSKRQIDTCMNYTRPPLAITIEPVRSAFVDAKERGIKLRYLTEVTNDNIHQCKDLMSIVDELRHLDGIKGNFMISEKEYLAPVILFEEEKIASHIIYSNQKEIVDQHQYMFDTLWNKAISAGQRVKEIEESIAEEHHQTRFLENPEQVSEEIKKTINTSEDDDWSICSTFDGLLMLARNKDFEMQGRLLDSNRRGKNTRWVGKINKDNIHLIKAYLDLGMKIKDIKNMPPMNFAISSKELYATIDEMKGGQIAKNLLISNEPAYIRHYISIFEDLWKNGVNAEDRIKELEEGIDHQSTIEVIQNPEESIKIAYDIIKSSKEEVLRMFSSVNAFRRQVRAGIMNLLREMVEKHGVKVRIMIPAIDQQQITQIVNEEVPAAMRRLSLPRNHHIDIRSIDKDTQTSIGILVVDRKESLIIETKDDTKDSSYDAAGLSVYSNSEPIALSYASIFETLWKQSELYEQLKTHDKMQKEFINIAAHELRTPIQPILGLTEVLKDEIKNTYQCQLIDVVIRNAKRLQRLTEGILDITKIESQSLQLNKEKFNFTEIISNAITDYRNQLKDNNSKIELVSSKEDFFLEGDRERLNQVISNLLGNAIKFTKEGTISINVMIKRKERENNQEVVVSVKDNGQGIDPEIFARLFTKFATNSETGGTGLGLFISKSIVEAHGGRIWAENNKEGKGATFSFSLPIVNE
jgi:two-component system sensor histidine kinase VicK